MKTRWLLLTTLAVIGCTSPPSAEDLELEELEQRWAPSYSAIPEQAPEAMTEAEGRVEVEVEVERTPGQPWIVVGRYNWRANEDSLSDDEGYSGESALCPFDVYADGFPAVTVEGDRVAESVTEVLSASDGEDEVMTVTWHGVDDDSIEHELVIYDGGDGWNQPYHRHCRALYQQAKAQAEQANRRLAQRQWRTMKPTGIFIHDPGDYEYDQEYREQILATPSWKRPAELTYAGRQAVARVPGVKVLARTDVDWTGSGDDEFCDSSPHLREVWGDEQTGAVAVYLDHQSGGCLCYSATEVHTLRWPEVVFVTAEREAEPRSGAPLPPDEA